MRSSLLTTALLLSASLSSVIALSVPRNLPTAFWERRHDKALEKRAISPPFPEDAQDKDLQQELKSQDATFNEWEPGWVPRACVEEATNGKFSASELEVRDVFYDDCEAAWTVCRHRNATESWETIILTLSQVPVGMRQYASNIVILAEFGEPGVAAYARGSVLTFYPTVFTSLGVIMHEFSHILDMVVLAGPMQAYGYPADTPFSHSHMWAEAYNSDSRVPSEYARTNLLEDFADAGRWAVSDVVHPGGLAKYSRDWIHCRSQIAAYETLLADIIFPKGNVCTAKAPSSEPMSIGEIEETENAKLYQPKGTLEGTMLSAIVLPPKASERLIVCRVPI
ncbi:hypothetical protein B0T22DRAFT_433826 [Podospora appendiculata]|uniref:Conidiation-specific protein 13 n=1 Tax=Podospora appendiculata TaxID=314037 RepID=A0AAE0WZT7_9PEZI|nr:hypothetical protein B0T22DRAFT_433826 [Podospora appendiculata]